MRPAEIFGKRVRAARKACGLTLKEAAERAHIHLNHLSQIERGTRRPSFELIFVLAHALGVPVMSLFVFEREVVDEKTLRRRISSLLEKATVEQLGQTYRFLRFVVGQ
jgi:transcriptional regulator with XRE-family HTH domain